MPDPARDAILARVRQALARPSPEPHWLHEPRAAGALFPAPAADDWPALAARFGQEVRALLGEVHEFPTMAAAGEWLAAERQTRGDGLWIASEHPLVRQALAKAPGVQWLATDEADHRGWERAVAGVAPAALLVAESGSVLALADEAGRLPTLYPAASYIVATRRQLVPDLHAAMAWLRSRPAGLPSALSFISGPSRTADIEKILVLGAHGPRRLAILLIADEGS